MDQPSELTATILLPAASVTVCTFTHTKNTRYSGPPPKMEDQYVQTALLILKVQCNTMNVLNYAIWLFLYFILWYTAVPVVGIVVHLVAILVDTFVN
jgi:hypothetical protein